MCEKLLEMLVVDGSDSIHTASAKIVWYLLQLLYFLLFLPLRVRERKRMKKAKMMTNGERVRFRMSFLEVLQMR